MLGLRFCARAFSSCGKRGPLFIAVRGPLTIAASLIAEHRLQTRRLSSCGSRAQLLCDMWDLPRPGLEPVSPALAGRLSTTAPPGKPFASFFIHKTKGFFVFIYLFIYFRLCWVFVSARGLSLVVASRGHSSSRCAGLSLSRPLLLRGTSSRRAGSVVVAHGPSCSAACGILPDQGSNPRPLHWQVDSQPLRHQGSPPTSFSSYQCCKKNNNVPGVGGGTHDLCCGSLWLQTLKCNSLLIAE